MLSKSKFVFKRGLEIRNRVIIAPMTSKLSLYDGIVSLDEIDYYASRSGEVGGFITGAANVSENGRGWVGELGVFDDKQIPRLSMLASAIKSKGTKAILQIFHAGRSTNSVILGGLPTVSASAVSAERLDAQVPKELSHDEILQIIDDFKKATERAIKAGFDGVELHGANTFLLQQFFSPHSNKRTDLWGGSIEKRFTFIDKVIDRVTEVVDSSDTKDFIVGYRFSPEEFSNPGISLEDTLYLIDRLVTKPLDYLHLSVNEYTRVSISHNYQDTTILKIISERINHRIPLIGVGSILTNADLENVLDLADLAAVGRAVLIDPHWTSKVLNGEEVEINTVIHIEDKEKLNLNNGLWDFLENMIPEKII